jgi:hypothetical protein
VSTRIDTSRCCGFNPHKGWDWLELMPTDPEDRCPYPARFLFRNQFELIPLCAWHYDTWLARGGRWDPVANDYSPGREFPDTGQPLWDCAYKVGDE